MNEAYVVARTTRTDGTVWTEGSLIPSEPWMRDGRCVFSESDLHFPHPSAAEQIHRAKAMCLACPVLADCLRYALEHGEAEGIWGATTPVERAAVHRLKESQS